VLQEARYLAPILIKLGRVDFAWSRQIDRYYCSDAAGPQCHDDNPIAQKNGLLDIVRYEYNGPLIALPYGQQLLLHQSARLCVERSKWLIHKNSSDQ
jgi:hypothetical protein